MKTLRLTAPLLPGRFHIGFRGWGVLGADIPSQGESGPGYGYPSVEADDLDAELWFPIVTPPANGGTFIPNEDTSFSYEGPSDSFTFRKMRNGVDEGTATATLSVGDAVALVSADYTISYAIEAAALVSSDYTISYAIESMPLVSADFTISYAIEAPAGEVPEVVVDISKVSAQRIVIFEGSGPRLEFEQMTAKPAYKVGDKWMVDRDPDEESRYAADITDELTDRMTTAVSDQIALVLLGVVSLSAPVLETVSINGVQRTFVIAFLGPDTEPIPADWSWAARVRCANGELFDKTTYFNRKDG